MKQFKVGDKVKIVWYGNIQWQSKKQWAMSVFKKLEIKKVSKKQKIQVVKTVDFVKDGDYQNRIADLESQLLIANQKVKLNYNTAKDLESKINELKKVADEMAIELEYLSEFNSVLTKYKELISK